MDFTPRSTQICVEMGGRGGVLGAATTVRQWNSAPTGLMRGGKRGGGAPTSTAASVRDGMEILTFVRFGIQSVGLTDRADLKISPLRRQLGAARAALGERRRRGATLTTSPRPRRVTPTAAGAFGDCLLLEERSDEGSRSAFLQRVDY